MACTGKTSILEIVLDFSSQGPLTSTLASQPESPVTVWIPEHVLVPRRCVHSRPSSGKGCAERAEFLSPSPCLAACHTGLMSSFKREQLRTFTLPWTDLGEVIARKLCWETSARPHIPPHGDAFGMRDEWNQEQTPFICPQITSLWRWEGRQGVHLEMSETP